MGRTAELSVVFGLSCVSYDAFVITYIKKRRNYVVFFCVIRSKPQFNSVSGEYVKIVCSFSNVCMALFTSE